MIVFPLICKGRGDGEDRPLSLDAGNAAMWLQISEVSPNGQLYRIFEVAVLTRNQETAQFLSSVSSSGNGRYKSPEQALKPWGHGEIILQSNLS